MIAFRRGHTAPPGFWGAHGALIPTKNHRLLLQLNSPVLLGGELCSPFPLARTPHRKLTRKTRRDALGNPAMTDTWELPARLGSHPAAGTPERYGMSHTPGASQAERTGLPRAGGQRLRSTRRVPGPGGAVAGPSPGRSGGGALAAAPRRRTSGARAVTWLAVGGSARQRREKKKNCSERPPCPGRRGTGSSREGSALLSRDSANVRVCATQPGGCRGFSVAGVRQLKHHRIS